MNWIKIKNECPEAFKLLVFQSMPNVIKQNYEACTLRLDEKLKITHFGNVPMNISSPMIYHRLLFDFFDACGIFINPTFFDAEIFELDEKKKLKRKHIIDRRKSRIEVEFTSFELAFSWLEEKIIEGKKVLQQ